ncbi:SSI family serine proteinase inhibitor [Kitasatospora sp. NPDC096147]|uniref:SSI family serine proteinase inhibitor n=1 Tax=Kitasatospora sp. NPDC096147 TaxID=3364093 RepID=UPI003826AE43
MTLRRLLPVVLGLAAACCAAPAVVPAQARPLAPQPAESTLVLTVSEGETVSPTPDLTTLNCSGRPSGTHAAPEAACTALAAADGDPDRLRGAAGTLCTAVYSPVAATAEGVWQGSPVKWSRTFGNRCQLRAATSPVF